MLSAPKSCPCDGSAWLLTLGNDGIETLLATILFEKFGQHQPLNLQSERYDREGIDLLVSTLGDQVGQPRRPCSHFAR